MPVSQCKSTTTTSDSVKRRCILPGGHKSDHKDEEWTWVVSDSALEELARYHSCDKTDVEEITSSEAVDEFIFEGTITGRFTSKTSNIEEVDKY